MIALGVDTSTADGSVAVVDPGRLLGEVNRTAGGHHQGRLLRSVDLLLETVGMEIGGVDLLAVALGPGSFTGLRVGIATVKGLALARGVPAYGLSTLSAMALHRGEDPSPVAAMIDAGRGEVFAGIYEVRGGEAVPLGEERSESPESFVARLPSGPLRFCGDGARRYRDLIRRSRGPADRIDPEPCFLGRTLARWGLDRHQQRSPWSLADLRPNYLRPPDAEIPRAR
jgi:tRNA threonylcarbamoyladenosine biosynthesis protein TsaB